MGMTEREIQDMLNVYPELTYQRKQGEDIFQGNIEIYHNETNSNVILTGEFGIKIVIDDEYPEKIFFYSCFLYSICKFNHLFTMTPFNNSTTSTRT